MFDKTKLIIAFGSNFEPQINIAKAKQQLSSVFETIKFSSEIWTDPINIKSENKYTVIDLKNKYRNRVPDGTTDGVHPSPETITEISEILYDVISNKKFINTSHTPILTDVEMDLIRPLNLNYTFDSRHGVVVESEMVNEGDELSIEFIKPQKISGIFYLMGPDSSSVDLHLDHEVVNVPMYDEMSFYRRVGYRYLGSRTISRIKVVSLRRKEDVKLVREPWEAVESIKNYIIGFSCGG